MKWKKLKESEGMSEFWEAINQFRPRKKRRGQGIRKQEWVEHFEKLLGTKQEGIGELLDMREEERVGEDKVEEEELEGLNKDISRYRRS